MSDPFYKFLSSSGGYKSYAHASGVYLGNKLARAPKLGFMYFVSFTLNTSAIIDTQWWERYKQDLGFLVKKIDLPKFKITTETLNQYNRKTNVQTKLTYEPITVEFHDDNSEITNGLWKNYYKYYFADSNYTSAGEFDNIAFGDSKYGVQDYAYGLSNGSQDPFFASIDIFVLHQGRFTQISIANPLITSWEHDDVEQKEGTKIMQNKMTVAYDNVAYYQGAIEADDKASSYNAFYYDNVPGSIGQGNQNTAPTLTGVFGGQNEPSPEPIPAYPTPVPPGLSMSQMDKMAALSAPAYPTPQPIGAGTFGLTSQRPPGLLSGISLWYGYGGLHGTGVVNAGPVRLVLKK